jgi:hypothetical protein
MGCVPVQEPDGAAVTYWNKGGPVCAPAGHPTSKSSNESSDKLSIFCISILKTP